MVACFQLVFMSHDEPLQINPPKTNMELQNGGLVQMKFLFKGVMFRFHVSFRGGIFMYYLKVLDVIIRCIVLLSVLPFDKHVFEVLLIGPLNNLAIMQFPMKESIVRN